MDRSLFTRARRQPVLLLAAAIALLVALIPVPAGAAGHVVYDAIPDPLPSGLGAENKAADAIFFHATGTNEMGQLITPDAGSPNTVTVTMSSRACADWEAGAIFEDGCGEITDDTGSSFDHEVTLNIYEVKNPDDRRPTLGDEILSVTQTVAIPYRPAADDSCDDVTQWKDDESDVCFGDVAFNVAFPVDLETTGGPVFMTVEFAVDDYEGDSWVIPPSPTPNNQLGLGMDVTSPSPDPAIGTAGVNYQAFSNGFSWVGDFDLLVMFRVSNEDPTTADDCKDGGYEAFGFSNQGQCVASVKASENAGK